MLMKIFGDKINISKVYHIKVKELIIYVENLKLISKFVLPSIAYNRLSSQLSGALYNKNFRYRLSGT
jgi:hypothetical protein